MTVALPRTLIGQNHERKEHPTYDQTQGPDVFKQAESVV